MSLNESLNKKCNKKIFELDVLGLRKSLVDIYLPCEMNAKCDADMRTLREYKNEIDDYDKIEKRINSLIKKRENIKQNDKSGCDCKIRAELKKVRELISFLDKNWAEGEIIIDIHLFLSIGLIASLFLMGILPLVHPAETISLGILNWAFLGITGGVLSVLFGLHEEGYIEIGETEGKRVLKKTISSGIIGGMTAILLFSGLISGLVSGELFPEISPSQQTGEMDWKEIGASIFWALFSGISAKKIYVSLTNIPDRTFGKDES